jgi:ubiquinone/menaquinone biosynthesis C-methylase UbiE
MTSETLEARVERERAAYDEEGLRRGAYNRVLRHTRHLYHKKRHALAGRLLREVPCDAMLEVGCDAWVPYVELNGITPGSLVCTNISQKELEGGIEVARHTRLRPAFRIMDAHRLEFPDHSFDVVFGRSILHHLDLETALRDVWRVLRPGGLFLFAEPLDNNPVGRLVRALTPKARTADERPFRFAQLELIGQYFDCAFHYEQLLSVPAGVVSGVVVADPDNALTRAAFRLDELLARSLPALGPYYRQVLIAGRPRREVLPAPA